MPFRCAAQTAYRHILQSADRSADRPRAPWKYPIRDKPSVFFADRRSERYRQTLATECGHRLLTRGSYDSVKRWFLVCFGPVNDSCNEIRDCFSILVQFTTLKSITKTGFNQPPRLSWGSRFSGQIGRQAKNSKHDPQDLQADHQKTEASKKESDPQETGVVRLPWPENNAEQQGHVPRPVSRTARSAVNRHSASIENTQ